MQKGSKRSPEDLVLQWLTFFCLFIYFLAEAVRKKRTFARPEISLRNINGIPISLMWSRENVLNCGENAR